MSEKEKMMHQKLYDANYDQELEAERIRCKSLCQKYNQLPVDHLDERHEFIKTIIGETGKNIHIEPDFWCDYGYRIKVGENIYANHGLIILDAGGVTFGHDVFIAPSCGFHTSGHPIDFERRNQGLEYAYPNPCHHVCRMAKGLGCFSSGKRSLELRSCSTLHIMSVPANSHTFL